MIICIEGIDASGKATQSKLLAEQLNAALFSFPDYTGPMGQLCGSHLKRCWAVGQTGVPVPPEYQQPYPADALVFQALQLASRMERWVEITAAAKKGHVVFDRYWPSGAVYGALDGIPEEYIVGLHAGLPQPGLFLLLDVDVKQSMARRPERRDRYESNIPFMERAAEQYRKLWSRMPASSWRAIDGAPSVERVAQLIRLEVADALERMNG